MSSMKENNVPRLGMLDPYNIPLLGQINRNAKRNANISARGIFKVISEDVRAGMVASGHAASHVRT